MGEFIINILNALIKGLGVVLNFVFSILPPSPFVIVDIEPTVKEFLGYANYIIPLDSIIGIGESWLVCVGIYYVYSIVLRWIKAIE